GTMIVPALPEGYTGQRVTGIAGKTGFSIIHVEKAMMNSEVGFGATLLDILATHDLPFEHCPTGIDTMSVVVNTAHLDPVREEVEAEIAARLHPDILKIEDGLAMIAVVGAGMIFSRGIAADVFRAVSDAGVNIRMIDQGSSEMNIIIGVQEEDYALTIQSIYQNVIQTK
ncbi:MAG: ACT domain-containing protein, partial [Oscillibacter sp.]|nr:ACT domain-containing protein [Oscillibacter sp.]